MLQGFLTVLLLASSVQAAFLQRRDTVIANSQRISTANAQLGTTNQLTTINAGVTYWLSGLGTHNIYGNLFNNGQVIISQTDYLATNSAGGQTCDWVGHTTTAGNLNISSSGSISVNDFGSASAPTYDWDIRSFSIYGSLQWCGRGDTGGSTYHLYCDLDCFNYGTIDYGQYFDNIGGAFFWRNANLAAAGATNYYNIYNYGAFRLTNVVFHNVQNIRGTGCIVIGPGGVLYLEDGTGAFQSYENGAYLPSLPGQSIYFTDNTGVLHMDTQVYSHNSNFGPQIYGYGTGNAIEFYETIRTSPVGYSYSPTTGILNVVFTSGNQVNIKLGLGYTAASFNQARNPQKYNTGGYNAIFYSGTEPVQATPTTCQPALETCTDPAQTAGPYGSRTYTTQTAAYTGTGTVTSTVAQASGTQPGTVVIYTPASYVTQTSAYNGAATTTTTAVQATGTSAGTVVVLVPATYVTQTSVYAGAQVSTSTVASASGTTPGTVVIYTPAGYVTTTQPYTGTDQLAGPSTSTIAPTGTSPGTVVIYTQAAFASTSLPYTGPGVITGPSTSFIAPSGTAPGTVVVYTPASYVTTTSTYTGPGVLASPSTSTVPPSGTAPGTVVVYSPAAYVTTSAPYTGPGVLTGPSTSTIAPSGTAPGTVVVYTPVATGYVTTTVPYTGTDYINGPITTTIAAPSGTVPGTVEVFTPTKTRPASVTTNIGPNQCFCTAV